MFFWVTILVQLTASISTAAIELSISYTNTFLYPFIGCAIIGISYSIIVVFLKTPQHDKFRSIKRIVSIQQSRSNTIELPENSPTTPKELDLDDLAEKTVDHLKDSENYKRLQNGTLALLMICVGCHGAVERGSISFITTYCNDYLQINDKYGRYYIICYYSGIVISRLMRQGLYANATPVWEVFIGFIARILIFIVFILFGTSREILFGLYLLIGISGGCCVPGMVAWGELIMPTTGIITAMWWVSYGVSDAIMSVTMGGLIEKYGAYLLPIVVIVPLSFAAILNGMAVMTFRILKKEEEEAFEQIQTPPSKSSTFDG